MSESNFGPRIQERLYQREDNRELYDFAESFVEVRETAKGDVKNISLLIECGHTQQVLEVLRALPPFSFDFGPEHEQILIRLVEVGEASAVAQLLLEKISYINFGELENHNFLELLIDYGQATAVAALVEKYSTQLNLKGEDNKTALLLHSLVLGGCHEQVVASLQHASDFFGADLKQSTVVLFSALAKKGYPDIAHLKIGGTCLADQITLFFEQAYLDEALELDFNASQLQTDLIVMGLSEMAHKLDHYVHQPQKPALAPRVSRYQSKLPKSVVEIPADRVVADCDEMQDTENRLITKARLELIAQYTGDGLALESSLVKKIQDIVNELNRPELQFLALMIKRYGAFSESMAKIWEGVANGAQFVGEIHKTGSELHIAGMGENAYVKKETGEPQEFRPIIFLHRIPQASANVWKTVHDQGVPVAPIISIIPETNNQAVVVSRYCGLSVMDFETNFANTVSGNVLLNEIKKQVDQIVQTLAGETGVMEKVEHGHTHLANFTIECIDREYVDEQIKAGKNINTVSFDTKHFNFDPTKYLQSPQQWQLVVRLIDWDRATFNSPQKIDQASVQG